MWNGLLGLPVDAQPDTTRVDTVETWEYDFTPKLSFSQSAYKDWKDGRSSTLSFTTSLSGTIERTKERWVQSHDFRGAFGLLRREDDKEDDPVRKTEDRIHIQSDLRYKGTFFFRLFRPTISGDLRTQFSRGFNFSNNPFPESHPGGERAPPVQTSEFFGPAYITETLGLTFASQEWFSVRVGIASKQTIVRDEDLRVLYSLDRSNAVRTEGGTKVSGTVEREVVENVKYNSQFNAFLSFNQANRYPDVVWENYITMEVNHWLSTDVEFVATYNENTSTALQLKEKVSVGVKANLNAGFR